MLVMDEYLTVEEVAQKLRVSTDSILRLIRLKRLTAYKIGGLWRITPADLQQYLDSQRNTKPEKS